MDVTAGPESVGQGQDDREWWLGNRARVFISCGQQAGPESDTASRVRDIVRGLGFCPYLAVEVHSPKGLTEGIYARLRTAEYCLFIDFRREQLGESGSRRGSLFSNQELGIASYLEVDVLPFLQRGIPLEGILKYIQGNPIYFEEQSQLPELIRNGIASSAWDSRSRRELRFERDPQQFERALVPGQDASGQQGRVSVRYYHLRIRNHHWRTLATDCIVHALWIRNIRTMDEARPDAVELKFKHVTWPTVSIPPSGVRQFDGVIVPEGTPDRALLGILNPIYVDSQRAQLQHTIIGPGDFEVGLVAYSREFAPARATLRIHLGASIDDVRVDLVERKVD